MAGERVLVWAWILLSFVLMLGGGLLAIFDMQLRLVGIALAVIGLLLNAILTGAGAAARGLG